MPCCSCCKQSYTYHAVHVVSSCLHAMLSMLQAVVYMPCFSCCKQLFTCHAVHVVSSHLHAMLFMLQAVVYMPCCPCCKQSFTCHAVHAASSCLHTMLSMLQAVVYMPCCPCNMLQYVLAPLTGHVVLCTAMHIITIQQTLTYPDCTYPKALILSER